MSKFDHEKLHMAANLVSLTGDTRKIFVDESNSARVLIGCKPITGFSPLCGR